ncbi:MAG: methyltransferase type 11 [Candidatus Saganbacteria bacterium]|uniref:Methyltransferase type 11 n=1 Tax=Candidatus Saganbacteria bacterium TaxID=2575572 RepID=A0A833L203_UNCSA|nr:MAG: methyltransferase type 11 [Candidatus Saganbacteria bacterium]
MVGSGMMGGNWFGGGALFMIMSEEGKRII